MAISRYETPAEQPILNTYVPIPYEQLMGTLKLKQAEQDQNLEDLGKSGNKLFDLKINKTFVDPLTNDVIENPDYAKYIDYTKGIQSQIEDLSGKDLTTQQYRAAARNLASNTANWLRTKGGGYVSNSDIYNKNMEDLSKLDDLNKGTQGRLYGISNSLRQYSQGGGYDQFGNFKPYNYGKYQDPIERVNKAADGIQKELTLLDAGYKKGQYGIEEYKRRRSEITGKKVQDTVIDPVWSEFSPIANNIANEEALKLSYNTGIPENKILNASVKDLMAYIPELTYVPEDERSLSFRDHILKKQKDTIAENARKLIASEGDYSEDLKFLPEYMSKKDASSVTRQTRQGGTTSNYGGSLNQYKTTDSGKRLGLGELYKEESKKQGTNQGVSYTPGGSKSLAPAATALFRFITGDRGQKIPTEFNEHFELLINPKGEKLSDEQRKIRSEQFLNNYNNTAIVIDALDPNDFENTPKIIKSFNDQYLGENNNGSGLLNGSKVWVINGTDEARPLSRKEVDELNNKNVNGKGLSYIGDLNPDNAIMADGNKPLERGLPGGHIFGDAENPETQYIVQANDEITKNPARIIKSKILAGKYFPNQFTISGEKFLSVPATDYDNSGALINTTDPDTGLPFKLYEIKNGKKIKVTNKNTLNKLIAK